MDEGRSDGEGEDEVWKAIMSVPTNEQENTRVLPASRNWIQHFFHENTTAESLNEASGNLLRRIWGMLLGKINHGGLGEWVGWMIES